MIVKALRTLLLLGLPGALTGSLLPVRTYTTDDGLPSIRVNRIVRDARGFLWFCTHDGLSRFDGYQFTNFGIDQGLPPGVTDLMTTDKGWYWVATREGLARFDTSGKGPLFKVFVPPDPDARWITALADDGAGGLWCGTSKGVYHFKRNPLPKQETTWSFAFVDIGMANETPDDRFVDVLLRDRDGDVWVGGYKGLYRGSAGAAYGNVTRRATDCRTRTLRVCSRRAMAAYGWAPGMACAISRFGKAPIRCSSALTTANAGRFREWWVRCWNLPMALFGWAPTQASMSSVGVMAGP